MPTSTRQKSTLEVFTTPHCGYRMRLSRRVLRLSEMNPKFGTNPDIITPNGSIRFTSNGIVLESGASRITIGPAQIEIVGAANVKVNGAVVNINNGALEVV